MIAVLVRSREIQEDSSTPLLLALNVSELLHGATFGMVSLILSWMGATDETVPQIVKQFQYVSMRTTRMGSLNLVVALAVVKLITIVKPLRSTQLITKTKVYLMLVLSFIVPLPACVGCAFSSLKYAFAVKETFIHARYWHLRVLISLLFSISLILYTFSYVYIFVCVVRQKINMRRLILPVEGSAPSNPVIAALKSAKGVMAVLTVYVVIYIPLLLLAAFNSESGGDLAFALYWLSYALGFVDVFAYVAFSRPARTEIKKFWSYMKVRNRLENTENSARSGWI